MAALFEAFLLGFYRRERPDLRAEAETMVGKRSPSRLWGTAGSLGCGPTSRSGGRVGRA